MEKDLDILGLCVTPKTPIREAAARMDKKHLGIVLVVDARGRLLGTVTDGDLRRALLAKISSDKPVSVLLARKKGTVYAKPLTAPVDSSQATCLAILKKHRVLHLPLLDKQ